MTYFTSRLNRHIDIVLFTSHPLDLPPVIYYLPPLIYMGMNILLLSLLKPHKINAAKPVPMSWIPGLCMILTLGFGFVMGLSYWEEILFIVPLTMSFFVLPLYFGLNRKRIWGQATAIPQKD